MIKWIVFGIKILLWGIGYYVYAVNINKFGTIPDIVKSAIIPVSLYLAGVEMKDLFFNKIRSTKFLLGVLSDLIFVAAAVFLIESNIGKIVLIEHYVIATLALYNWFAKIEEKRVEPGRQLSKSESWVIKAAEIIGLVKLGLDTVNATAKGEKIDLPE